MKKEFNNIDILVLKVLKYRLYFMYILVYKEVFFKFLLFIYY